MSASDTLLEQAEQLLRDGDPAAAQHLARQALEAEPGYWRGLLLAGKLERLAGRHEAAQQLLEQAAALNPEHVGTHLELAQVHRRARDFERSMDELFTALYHDPGNADAYCELGFLHRLRGEHDLAIDYFKQAIEKNPGHARALSELGWIYSSRKQFSEALPLLERAVRLDPLSIPAQNNLGYVCVRLEEYARALEIFRDLCEHSPKSMLWQRINLGSSYDHAGRFADSEIVYADVLRREPNNFVAHWNTAHHALARGEFAKGWADYQYRLQVEGVWHPRLVPFAPWKGEPVEGRTVVVSAEQGLGDQIMFASCIPDLLARGARVVLECDHRLASLFQRSFPEVRVIGSRHETVPPWLRDVGMADFHVPAGSLPGFFRASAADFPRHQGYLRADEEKVRKWRDRLAALGPGLKVGLSWRGGTRSTRRQLRSQSLPDLLGILSLPGIRFVCLQYGEVQKDIDELRAREGIDVAYWREAIADYDETAALCSALDLTVSVCTSVIHLNGALGRPIWVMVPTVAEWRYGRQGEQMPWYPSVRLLRQASSADWAPVHQAIAQGLARLVGRPAA